LGVQAVTTQNNGSPPATPTPPALSPAAAWVEQVRVARAAWDLVLSFRQPPADATPQQILTVFQLLAARPGYPPTAPGDDTHDAMAVEWMAGTAEQLARRTKDIFKRYLYDLAVAMERAIQAGARCPEILAVAEFNGHIDVVNRGGGTSENPPPSWVFGAVKALPADHPFQKLGDRDTVEDPRRRGRGPASHSRWICLGKAVPGSNTPRVWYPTADALALTQAERWNELAILRQEREAEERRVREAEARRQADTPRVVAELEAEVARLRREVEAQRQATTTP
jgi:hypothetical protein